MKKRGSILKHLDFIILDIFIVELSFFLANIWYAQYAESHFTVTSLYRVTCFILFLCVMACLVIDEPYKNILKRNRYIEVREVFTHTLMMMLMNVFFIFFSHIGGAASRLTTTITWFIYIPLTLISRYVYKRILRIRFHNSVKSLSSAVVLTSNYYAEEVINALQSNPLNKREINGIFLVDYDPQNIKNKELNILGGKDELIDYAVHNWVDEVFLFFPGHRPLYKEMEEICDTMGLTSHRILLELRKDDPEVITPVIQKIGDCVVATHKQREVPMIQWFLKRALDIIGGLAGCLITILITIIIGPMIYFADPGPIFYGSKRVGKNGKLFTMYKFRSMYQDADARKAELMKQNKMHGAMFKIDDDPRIIGSEKKDKNGKPKGIGNFIRNTSLDEFPQFLSVLLGERDIIASTKKSAVFMQVSAA